MNKEDILLFIMDGDVDILKLKVMLSDMNNVDIADIMEYLESDKFIQMFRILPKAIASDVFANMDSDHQQAIVREVTAGMYYWRLLFPLHLSVLLLSRNLRELFCPCSQNVSALTLQ